MARRLASVLVVTCALACSAQVQASVAGASVASHRDAGVVASVATSSSSSSPVCTGGVRRRGGLGVYTGAADPSGVAAFASSTGHALSLASDFLPANQGWAGMSDAGRLAWLLNAWRGSGCTLVLGVPLVPTDASGNPQGTLAAGAAGAYNGAFATLARTLVSDGWAGAVLRLGWEFNVDWHPWEVTDAADAANYAGYWRQVVDTMRSVAGQSFAFVWNPNSSTGFGTAYTPDQAYPGDPDVTYVGTDVYDSCWCSPPTPRNAWRSLVSQPWGLRQLARFAASHHKHVVVPEWGVSIRPDGHGLGDDPSFVASLRSWAGSHRVAWTSYFNFDAPDGRHNLFDGSFPRSLAQFRALRFRSGWTR